MKFISRKDFFKLLDVLKTDYDVFVPFKEGTQRFFDRYTSPNEKIVLGEVRPFEPLKVFFTRAREVVAQDFNDTVPSHDNKPFAVVGVKACDLKGFKVQDYVFKDHDYEDPFYLKNRQENLIISCDCTCALETCFCLGMDVTPYPQENYDLNLSEIEGGFVVETGSPKGEKLINNHSSFFQNARPELIAKRDGNRKSVTSAIEENISKAKVPAQDQFAGMIERNFEAKIWEEEANTCVECGACNMICPTCHCFLLYDQKDEKKMERLRIWDSCMLKDFARVAGGANPRPKLWMRLRNRFEKKFDFFPKVADIYACTGCGRCITACPAKIDIRKVLKRLVDNA